MNKFYCVTYKTIVVFKVSDEEMRENGYEGEITDEMRKEYLDNLVCEYNLDDKSVDDIEIEEMTLTKKEEKEVIKKGAYSNA